MRNAGKRSILGVLVNAVDIDGAEEAVIRAARGKLPLSVSALAVHGLMTGVFDREQKFRLNQFDLLVPDGQPVRWALNWLHRVGLSDRVYGPNLMLEVCARAGELGLPVFLFGGTAELIDVLEQNLRQRFP